MMEHKNIDRLFQEKFKDFEVHPPEETWNAIEAELNKKEKKRIIPLWWKFSGVAALLAIGVLLYSTFTNEKLNTIPEYTPDSNNVVLDNHKEKESETNSNGLEINESSLDETTNNSITPIKNPVRNNQTVTSVEQNKLNNHNGNPTKKSNTNRSNLKQSASNSSPEAVVKNEQNEKYINKNLLLSNKLDTNPSSDNPKTETGVVVNENQSKLDLNKYKTAEELNKLKGKDSANVTAVAATNVEPNALEELLKEKEKEEKSKELKVNRWQITSAVAPVYFNSASNGSPIDSQFESNTKEYENNLTFGVGVQYALSKKVTVRSGLNQVSMGYNTNDILYQASLGRTGMNTLNTSNEGASIVVMSKNNSQEVSFNSFSEGNALNANDGTLNQQMGYLEMPLELSYKLLDRKFGIQFIGGISTLFLTENQVVVRSPGFEFDLGEANNLNQVHFSSNVGIGFNYSFWKSFQANFEPMFKYQLNTFSNEAGNFKPYFIGLYSGISYRF
jgi:hypothetical protein